MAALEPTNLALSSLMKPKSAPKLIVKYFCTWESARICRQISLYPEWSRPPEHPNVPEQVKIRADVLLLCLIQDGCPIDENCWLREITDLKNGFACSRLVSPSVYFCKTKDTAVINLMVDRSSTGGEPWISSLIRGRRTQESIMNGVMEMLDRGSLRKLHDKVARSHDSRTAAELFRFLSGYSSPNWQELGRRGLLLSGPPGTGKSTICRELLRELCISQGNAKSVSAQERILFSGTAADLNSRYVGESESKIRNLLMVAAQNRNQIYFFFLEEIDTLASSQERSLTTTVDWKRDVVAVLLDTIALYENVIWLATTNFESGLDERLLRPGRFSKSLLVLPPSRSRRLGFFQSRIAPLISGLAENMKRTRGLEASGKELSDSLPCFGTVFVERTRSFSLAQLDDVFASFSTWLDSPHEMWTQSHPLLQTGGRAMKVFDALLIFIAEAATRSSTTTGLYRYWLCPLITSLAALKSNHIPTRTDYYMDEFKKIARKAMGNTAEANLFQENLTGRLHYFAQSNILKIERNPEPNKEQNDSLIIRLPQICDAAEIASVVDALCNLWEVDSLVWIGAEARHEHSKNFEGFLMDLVLQARTSYVDTQGEKARSMLVLDVDTIVGMTPVAFHLGRSEGNTRSIATTQSLNGSTSVSNGSASSWSFGLGLSTGKSTTYTVGENTNYGFSERYIQTPRPPDNQPPYGVADERGFSYGGGTVYNEATAETSGANVNLVGGKNQSETTSVQFGGSSGQTNSNQSSTSTSTTVDVSVQYPEALSAIANLMSMTNKRNVPTDPFILLVFRSVESPHGQELLRLVGKVNA